MPGRPPWSLGPGALALVLLTAAPSLAGDTGSTRPAPTGAPGGSGGAATDPAGAVDAELLRDLDLLTSPDYRRDREMTRRMPLLEQLRMLETLRGSGAPPAAQAGTPATRPAPKEAK
ncbi:MAG: hypothetical protein ABW020_13665 [Candidatus Rokuibacteriota bacterium]